MIIQAPNSDYCRVINCIIIIIIIIIINIIFNPETSLSTHIQR